MTYFAEINEQLVIEGRWDCHLHAIMFWAAKYNNQLRKIYVPIDDHFYVVYANPSLKEYEPKAEDVRWKSLAKDTLKLSAL
jgi:hypothetical protein